MEYLNEKEAKIYKEFLNTKDYVFVAKKTDHSVQTVINILNRNSKFTKKNKVILPEIKKMVEIKVLEKQKLINEFNELQKN